MSPQDMTREEWRQYTSDHGPLLERAFSEFRAAAEALGQEIKAMEAHESSLFRPHLFASDMEESAKRVLPDELRTFLENTTAPMLPLETKSSCAHSMPSAIAANAGGVR